MERLIEVLRQDMNRGFDQINARLDRMNGNVRHHGEAIAVLTSRMDRNDVTQAVCKTECRADIDKLNELTQAVTVDTATKKRLLAILGMAAGAAATVTTVVIEIITYWASK